MQKFLVLYSAPAAILDAWMQKPAEERKEAEQKMMAEWKQWMSEHAKMFADVGAGVGATKRVTLKGVADTRNDIMLYAIIEAGSHDAAAKLFIAHPHLDIPEASIEIIEIRALPPM